MDKFLNSLENNLPPQVIDEGKVAVALSGGADSLALLYGLTRIIDPERIIALHCNFGLRGNESDRDEAHANNICKRLEIKLFTISFSNLREEMLETGESIEMICRRYRYEWFAQFVEKDYWIALGHHREDNRETMFLNLMRGTGVKGLAGMRTVDNERHLLRPLLSLSRQEIEEFLSAHGIEWITDSSNLVPDVKRNKLRLKLFPEIERLFSADAFKGIDNTIQYSSTDYRLLKEYLDKILESCFNSRKQEIDMKVLRGLTSQPTRVVFELLRHYGFNYAQCKAMCSVEAGTGFATFLSGNTSVHASHDVIKIETSHNEPEHIEARTLKELVEKVPGLSLETVNVDNGIDYVKNVVKPSHTDSILILDAHSVDACLHAGDVFTWRSLKEGDRIKPFGMGGRSRLASDILTDSHASPADKMRTRLLTAGDKALWLAPLRTSFYHTVKSSTKRIYILRHDTLKKKLED